MNLPILDVNPVYLLFATARLAFIAFLLAELVARTGCLVLPARRMSSRLEEFGLGFLAGLLLLGMILLGLGCAGLTYNLTTVAAVILPALAGLWRGPRRFLAFEAVRETLGSRRNARGYGILGPWTALPLLLAIPLAFLLSVPYISQDAAVYHVGAPWQFLLAHKVVADHAPFPFLFPLPVEITYLVPLALGEFRLIPWLNFIALLSALAIFLGRGRTVGRAGLAAGLTLALSVTFGYLPGGKSDPAVSAFFIAGAVLAASGSTRAGALMLGAAAGAKYTTAPLALIWLIFVRPPAGRRGAVAAGLLLPALPWLVRSWLSTADPVFPFGGGLFPSPFWIPANENTFLAYATPMWEPFTLSGRTLFMGWIGWLARNALPALLFLPGLFATGFSRREALACVFGAITVTYVSHIARYAIPAVMYLCLIAPRAFTITHPALARAAAVLLSVWAILRSVGDPAFRDARWADALKPAGEMESVLEEASGIMGRLGVTRAISAGEWSNWPVSVRLLSSGNMGETPLIWRAARDSGSADRIAVKLRQSGAQAIIQNTVSSDWHALCYAQAFAWDGRMLGNYRDFALRWLEPAGQTERCDFANGGYQIYRLRRAPLSRPLARLPGLPGTETLTDAPRRLRVAGDLDASSAGYRKLVRDFPEILSFRAELGYDLCSLGLWEEAWRTFQPGTAAGLIHPQMSVRGMAALKTGRMEEARREFREDSERYPFNATLIDFGIADSCLALAKIDMKAGRYGSAAGFLDEASKALDHPTQVPVEQEPQRLERVAAVKSLETELAKRRKPVDIR